MPSYHLVNLLCSLSLLQLRQIPFDNVQRCANSLPNRAHLLCPINHKILRILQYIGTPQAKYYLRRVLPHPQRQAKNYFKYHLFTSVLCALAFYAKPVMTNFVYIPFLPYAQGQRQEIKTRYSTRAEFLAPIRLGGLIYLLTFLYTLLSPR